MKHHLDIHSARDGSIGTDRAILDLLQLEQLDLAPGVVPVALLKALWRLSQPQVCRRVNAIAGLGIYQVCSGHGRYTLIRLGGHQPEQLSPKERWDAARRQLREVVG